MSGPAALDRLLDALRDRDCRPRQGNGGQWSARCPAHEDHAPSLSIGDRDDRTGVVVRCHAGCSTTDVLAALGLAPADLFDAPRQARQRPVIVATYPYTDEAGALLFEKVRMAPKDFRQRRPVGTGWEWKLGDVRRVLYRLPDVAAAIEAGTTVYLAEGEKDADALAAHGVTATTWTEGAWQPGNIPKWKADYTRQLAGAHVVIVRDRDDAGRHTAATVAGLLSGAAASVAVVEPVEGKDASDHLAAGHSVAELVPIATDAGSSALTLEDAHAVFRRWLGAEYDLDALDVMLATAAVERLDGDPLWLLIISGPGNAKTETVQALDGIGATVTSTISSPGALLSATSKRERSEDATGGLLRKLGERGVLVIKDVTSVLSMNRDMRAEVLGAVREMYDGRWSRNVGTDGGRTLEWAGRIAVVGAVTTAWDRAHDVIASMGDRFVLLRMDSTTGRQAAGRQAIGNTGSEVTMRAELAAVVAGVMDGMRQQVPPLTEAERDRLLVAADLVTLARTGVEYDYRGDVIDAHAPEMPTRFAKQLAQIIRGSLALGVDRGRALRLAIRCARDSMPPLRLAIVDDLAAHPDSTTAEVRKRLGKPRNTVDRQLQALHMLQVLECDEEEIEWSGRQATRWHYRLAEGIDPTALDPKSVPDLSVPTPNPDEEEEREDNRPCLPTDISGTDSRADQCAHLTALRLVTVVNERNNP